MEGRPVAAPSALAIILHRLVDQVRVWQCNDRVHAGSEQSRAQADLDDLTLCVLGQYPVTDLEWPVDQNGDRTEEVGDGVLSCESKSETGDTYSSDEGGEVEVQRVGDEDRTKYNDEEAQHALKRADQSLLRTIQFIIIIPPVDDSPDQLDLLQSPG